MFCLYQLFNLYFVVFCHNFENCITLFIHLYKNTNILETTRIWMEIPIMPIEFTEGKFECWSHTGLEYSLKQIQTYSITKDKNPSKPFDQILNPHIVHIFVPLRCSIINRYIFPNCVKVLRCCSYSLTKLNVTYT